MSYLSDQPTVIVVGSLHYDIMMEAPDRPRKGETINGEKWYPKFGGKGGNQAIAAAKSGVSTRFVGSVGHDSFADFMLAGLQDTGISTRFISKNMDHGTGMSVAIMDHEGDYGAVIVSGANLHIDPTVFDNDELWHNAKVLILQNEIPEAINLAAARKAKQLGVTTCLNAAPSREMSDEFLAWVDILIVNAIEAEDMCGVAVNSLESAGIAAAKLYDEDCTIIVTAGGAGVAAKSDDNEFMLEAIQVELVSTHGAGDMFVGTLCAQLAKYVCLEDAVTTANKAAALHVSER